MGQKPIVSADHGVAVKEWFSRLSRYCAAVDYDSARAIFAGDVVSFGTRAEIVTGLDRLVAEQWQGIWPNISDFRIDLASVRGGGAGDLAWGAATWASTGYDAEGRPFHRPGRATIVLERRRGAWLCIHSHFSLVPGTSQRTFGRR
ncbi:MAG: nuclear transport factor 2 family protein [Chloroflexi bacterium]|nr:nuclear transport factor 2 family protein [Chloroflexota bacterium]